MRLSVFAAHARRRLSTTLALVTLAATSFAQAEPSTPTGQPGASGAQGSRPDPTLALAEQHPFLRDVSTWQQHVTQPEGGKVDKSKRGAFPVGNGSMATVRISWIRRSRSPAVSTWSGGASSSIASLRNRW